MLSSKDVVDAALQLGPIEGQCNLCGKTHVFRPLVNENVIDMNAYRDPFWCMTERAAVGLLHADCLQDFAAIQVSLHDLDRLLRRICGFQPHEDQAFVRDAIMMFPGAVFHCTHDLCYNIEHELRFSAYEYLVVPAESRIDKVAVIQAHILKAFSRRVGGVGFEDLLHPWILLAPEHIANGYVASLRIRAWMTTRAWSTFSALTRQLTGFFTSQLSQLERRAQHDDIAQELFRIASESVHQLDEISFSRMQLISRNNPHDWTIASF